MATKLKEVDVLLVGSGWTGGILAKELTAAGHKVVALERGGMRSTENDFSVPRIRDDLRFCVAQRPDAEPGEGHADDTQQSVAARAADAPARLVPARRRRRRRGRALERRDVALERHRIQGAQPLRGALRQELHSRRHDDTGLGQSATPSSNRITTSSNAPPRVSGKAGNLRGAIQTGGNPFEAPRAREYPLPPLESSLASRSLQRGGDQRGTQSVPVPDRERLARLHQSRRLEVRRLPVLRLLRALRLRSECQGQPAYHRDPDRDAQSEFRIAHACVGDEGAEGLAPASA